MGWSRELPADARPALPVHVEWAPDGRYRHAAFAASANARNVMVAGAREMLPLPIDAPAKVGKSSFAPNVSSVPFRCTRLSCRLPTADEDNVYRSPALGTVRVREAVVSVLRP